jgi:hypothetical protein
VRKGLLYAATELGVFVSFNDGDHWQSLQLNLPVAPVHDLAIHGADLIAATHGRAFWVLDDITPLRQLTPAFMRAPVILARPAPAYRLRQSENRETPLPPEIPHGNNPPTGAVIDYWLASRPTRPIVIDILDARGTIVRHFSSGQPTDTLRAFEPMDPPYFMTRWLPQAQPLPANPGHNRFVWDLRFPRPSADEYSYSSGVVPGLGAEAQPDGALVLPGDYQVRLTVGTLKTTQPLHVVLDPRSRVAPGALEAQLKLATQLSAALTDASGLSLAARTARDSLDSRRSDVSAAGAGDATSRVFQAIDSLKIGTTAAELASLANTVGDADRPPTAGMQAAFAHLQDELAVARDSWRGPIKSQLDSINTSFKAAGLRPLTGSDQ